MKNLLAITFIHLLAGSLFAQKPLQQSAHTVIDNFPNNYQTLVFGNKINVREAPKKDAQVLTQLLVGEAVTILSTDTAQLTQNGWTTSWVKIAFNKNGKRQEGYAWGGLLSFSAVQVGDISFVYGVVKKSENDSYGAAKYEIEFRAVRNYQIISSTKEEVEMDDGHYTMSYLYGNLGLTEYKNVLSCRFDSDVCGYPQYEVVCLWDGSKLELLPTLNSSYDGSVFRHSESYLFPESENGIPDALLFQMEEEESEDEWSEAEGNYDYTRRVRKMTRNEEGIWEKPNLEDEERK